MFQKMLMNQLMGQLKMKNPQAYNQILQMQSSGKDPNQVLNELMSSGKFSQSELNNAQQVASQLSKDNKNKF